MSLDSTAPTSSPSDRSWRGWFTRVAWLDPRSVAVVRIGLALLTVVDLGARLTDLDAFYSDEGVLPRSVLHLPDWDFLWSFHLLSGSRAFLLILFALHLACALALLFGYRTRLATVLCFVFAASLQARNPLLRDGHDDLIRVLLFFGIFLPWDARFSLDARAGRARPVPAAPSWGAAGFLAQLCLVYWAGVIGKLQSPWWRSGQAVVNALSLGRYETPLGQWALHFPRVLHLLVPAVLLAEVFAPGLLLLARRRTLARTLAAVTMILLHASLGACLRLGLFPGVSIVAWLAVIPGEVWDHLLPATAADTVEVPEPRFVRAAVVVGLLIAMGGNVLVMEPQVPLAHGLGRLASLVGLQQYWLLFAPTREEAAHLEDGYYVEVAQQSDGQTVDLMSPDGKLTWERPALVSNMYANRRWRHYLANLLLSFPRGSSQFATLMSSRQAYARFLCGHHPTVEGRFKRMSVYFVARRFGHPEETPTRQLLAQEYCE